MIGSWIDTTIELQGDEHRRKRLAVVMLNDKVSFMNAVFKQFKVYVHMLDTCLAVPTSMRLISRFKVIGLFLGSYSDSSSAYR